MAPRLLETEYAADSPILTGVAGLRAPKHITLDETKHTANSDGNKTFNAGYFVAQSGDYGRLLPRTTLADSNLTAASSTVVNVPTEMAQLFVDADVLRVLAPMAQIDLAATWAASDTIATTIDGTTVSTIAAGSDLAAIATLHASELNADVVLGDKVTAIASGDSVWIYSDDFSSQYSVSVTATTAGDGTGAISGSLTVLTAKQSIGTIDTAGVNTVNDTLVINAAASIDVPVGMPIGVDAKPLGLMVRSVDLVEGDLNVGLYTSASVDASNLPYDDGQLKALFPEITRV